MRSHRLASCSCLVKNQSQLYVGQYNVCSMPTSVIQCKQLNDVKKIVSIVNMNKLKDVNLIFLFNLNRHDVTYFIYYIICLIAVCQ